MSMSASYPIPIFDITLREDPVALKSWIKQQAYGLGFNDCVIAHPDTSDQLPYLIEFLEAGFHGDMHYLETHLEKRAHPPLLVEGTRSIICVRLDYLVQKPIPRRIDDQPHIGVVARYAQGRDYHKTMRGKLKQLAQIIERQIGPFQSRPFSDSAPIFEKALAEQAGMGWTGKHTLLINRHAGSFFVLGELFCNLALPVDQAGHAHCGSCQACIDICPTAAIVAPYRLDARRCIAYLTIEHQGRIAPELRPLIGNRVFGCDDCQLICPWNRYAQVTTLADFQPRHGLDHTPLLTFWQWDEATFLAKTEGSPLRRTGFQAFKRNVAIALGNAPQQLTILQALQREQFHGHCQHDSNVQEHTDWAIAQQLNKT